MSCEKERMFLEVDSDLFEAYNSAPESKRKTLQILLKSWLKEADISIDHELQLQLGDLEEDMTRTLSRIGNRFGELLNKFLSISDYGSDEKNKHSARVQLLKQIPLFTELSSFDLGLIAEQMEEFLVSADKELLVQGEKANAVFFLEEGSVAIIVNNELVAHLGEGDCFGEMSCLRNESTASATVRTVTACVVLRIPREKFLETVSRAPQLWRNLFLQATNRVKHINKRLSEVMHHTPQGLAKLDSEGRFTNEFSIQCLQFFGEKKLVGKQFSKLVFPALLEQQSDWNQLYQVLFSNTKVSFKAVARMLPSELKYKHQEEREKVF
ncbi:MAG: CRP-like cAMP-binding protein, partial [bacterium]